MAMSGSELEQLESLAMRVLPDPRGFADRVLGQLVERLAVGVPVERPAPVADPPSPDPASLQVVLAAALGACECWGDDPACAVCGGAGSPAWLEPDEELFREYVLPAVRRRATSAADGRRPGALSEKGAYR